MSGSARVTVARVAPRRGRSADRLASGLRAARPLLAAVVTGPVGPAVARLARGAEVDVDELAVGVDADAQRAVAFLADVERLGELVELADRDALDADVHRRGVEVPARVALVEPEAGYQIDALARVVIADPRQVLVELGAHGADVAAARVAPQIVELGERGLVERTVVLVDVALELLAEVLGAQPDLARRLVERIDAQRGLRGVVALEHGDAATRLLAAALDALAHRALVIDATPRVPRPE